MDDSDCEDEYEEINDEIVIIECLFCENISDCLKTALNHLDTVHNFNLINFKLQHSLDDYSYRKFINFIRKHKISCDKLKSLDPRNWDSDDYLIPVNQHDAWLMMDIEDSSSNINCENALSNYVTISKESQMSELQEAVKSLKIQLEQKNMECLLMDKHIEELKKNARQFMIDEEEFSKQKKEVCVRNCNLSFDQGYFNTYSHFAIHHEMLTDKVRTESYRDALLTNSHLFKDGEMLDVGCGTAILSMFAAKAGCKKVVAVDQSDIIYHAIDIVRENNLDDIIVLKKGRLEDIDIGVNKVDAIISEWMGYFLLFEGMLDSVIFARDKYLRPGGKLLPNRCTISIVGSGDSKYKDLLDYWSDVYGFKMSCMKAEVLREPIVEYAEAGQLITSVAEVQSFDLYEVQTDCINFSSEFQLIGSKNGLITAIVGYFDIFFDLDNPVDFSTGPTKTRTHWKQTVFPLCEPLKITEGEVVKGKIVVKRHIKDVRGLIVTVSIKHITQLYYLD